MVGQIKEQLNRIAKNQSFDRPLLEKLAFLFVFLMSLTLLMATVSRKIELTLDDGRLIYVGDVQNHRLNGYGELTYDNGDSYKGQFKKGVFHGEGTFVSHLGWTYKGEFKNGQADGKGVLNTEDKAVYDGTFKQGIYQK
ncbi:MULTISPECIES: hypothetical protein [unclassified Streptococcus]|uniref:hypothetical protein n=1 Tax=unclassified Streptococcus TaxID=2608887 RepID=UPI00359DBD56